MAALLTRSSEQPQEDNFLLSSFAPTRLQEDNIARDLVRSEKGRNRKGKNGQKKQPQRGLGVAQLEKLRLAEEQSKQEAAARFTALQGQAHTFYRLRSISPLEDENTSFMAQRSGGNTAICFHGPKVVEPEKFSVKQGSESCDIGLRNSLCRHGFHSSSEVTSPLSLLQRFNVWNTGSTRASACKSSMCKTVSGGNNLEEDGEGKKVQSVCSQQQSEPARISLPPAMETQQRNIGSLVHGPDRCIQFPVVRGPSMAEKMEELSSFQSVPVLFTGSSAITNEVIHFKRRSCATIPDNHGNLLSEIIGPRKSGEVHPNLSNLGQLRAVLNHHGHMSSHFACSIRNAPDYSSSTPVLNINRCKEDGSKPRGACDINPELRIGPPRAFEADCGAVLFPHRRQCSSIITAAAVQPYPCNKKVRLMDPREASALTQKISDPCDFLSLGPSSRSTVDAADKGFSILGLPTVPPTVQEGNNISGVSSTQILINSYSNVHAKDCINAGEIRVVHGPQAPAAATEIDLSAFDQNDSKFHAALLMSSKSLSCSTNANTNTKSHGSDSIDLTLKLSI